VGCKTFICVLNPQPENLHRKAGGGIVKSQETGFNDGNEMKTGYGQQKELYGVHFYSLHKKLR